MRTAILVVIAGLASLPAVATEPARDGNWWRSMAENSQHTYMVGAVEGVRNAHAIATTSICLDVVPMSALSECTTKAAAAVRRDWIVRVANLTAPQTKDGVDAFYADYRNRNIHFFHALRYVFASAGGMSQAELDQWVAQLRTSAQR